MQTLIAWCRGVNVGGNRMLPMRSFASAIESAGGTSVRTYIQSGNAVFRAQKADTSGIAARIVRAIAASHGFEPHVLVVTLEQLEAAAAANPFPEALAQPATLHLFFLSREPPHADLAGMRALATGTERFALDGRVFYLHTPDGFGKSKLAGRAEKLLGVEATARNWRTVATLLQMARDLEAR